MYARERKSDFNSVWYIQFHINWIYKVYYHSLFTEVQVSLTKALTNCMRTCTCFCSHLYTVTWEPERRYQYSKMFHVLKIWEPEGCYRCTMSMAITPIWFSTEHLWVVIAPFWLSTDDMRFANQSLAWWLSQPLCTEHDFRRLTLTEYIPGQLRSNQVHCIKDSITTQWREWISYSTWIAFQWHVIYYSESSERSTQSVCKVVTVCEYACT